MFPGTFNLQSLYSNSTFGEKRFWRSGIPLHRFSFLTSQLHQCDSEAMLEMEMESDAAQGGLAFKTGQNSFSEECTDCRDGTYGFYLNLSGTVVL